MTQWVYGFGNGSAEGRADMKNLLGGKGANLAEMSRIGLPVPPGFTITTEVCTYYYANKKTYPKVLDAQAEGHRLHRENHGHQVRRQGGHAAARLRPFRRARFDARHDGHHFQPRPQPHNGRSAREAHRQSAVCISTPIAASFICIRMSS